MGQRGFETDRKFETSSQQSGVRKRHHTKRIAQGGPSTAHDIFHQIEGNRNMRIHLVARISCRHVGDRKEFPEGSAVLVTYVERFDFLMMSLSGETTGNQVSDGSRRIGRVDVLSSPVGRVSLAQTFPTPGLEQAVEVRDDGWPIKIRIKCGLSFA